jgi:parvulin-like peptidyl-prolyl isomerase
MPEAFSRAAFALAEQEISEPVVTPFGVHLVQCLGVEAGKRSWQDARSEIEAAMVQYLFAWAADRQRAQCDVRFTGALPSPEEVAEQGSTIPKAAGSQAEPESKPRP